ncbi:protein stum-like [Amphibalanus amphitrite]|uniref:protein stum-like n=1 Tax=Amphibalanus amphitrite TaxID=1232801 RepID=UPI001C92AB59|nr:protein stum-like [Amphibalanus amphitrite]
MVSTGTGASDDSEPVDRHTAGDSAGQPERDLQSAAAAGPAGQRAGQSSDHVPDKSAEPSEQSSDQSSYQSSDKSSNQSSDKSSNQSLGESTTKSLEQPPEKSSDQLPTQSSDKSSTQSPDQASAKSSSQSLKQSLENSSHQPSHSLDPSSNQSHDQTSDKTQNPPPEQPLNQISNQSLIETSDQSSDLSPGQSSGEPISQPSARSSSQLAEKPSQQSSEDTPEKPTTQSSISSAALSTDQAGSVVIHSSVTTTQPHLLPGQPIPLPKHPDSLIVQADNSPEQSGTPSQSDSYPGHLETLLEEPDLSPGQPVSLPGQFDPSPSQNDRVGKQPVSFSGELSTVATVEQLLPSSAEASSASSSSRPTRSPKPPKIRITRPPRESSVFASLLPGRSRAGPVAESRAKYRAPTVPRLPAVMSGRRTAFGGDSADPARQRTSVFDRLSRPDTRSRGRSSVVQERPQPPAVAATSTDETSRPRAEELYDRLISGRSLHDQPDSSSKEISAPRTVAATVSVTEEKPATPPRLVPPLPRQPTVASISIEDETRPAPRQMPGTSTKQAAATRGSVFDRLYGAKTGRVRAGAKGEQNDGSAAVASGAPPHDGSEAKDAKENEKSQAVNGRKGNADAGKRKDTVTKDSRAKKEKAAKSEVETSDETDNTTNDDKTGRKRDKQSSLYDRLFAGKPTATTSERTSLVEERETVKRQEAKKRINKRKIQPKPEKRPTEVPKRAPRAPARRQGGSVFDRLYRGVPVHATRDSDLLTPEGTTDQSRTRRRSSDASASDQDSEPETRPRSKSPVKRSSSGIHMADVALVSAGEESRLQPGVLPHVKRTKAFSIFGVPVVFPGRLFGRRKREDGDVESLREKGPQLDPSMVNTTSMARGAIPVLPRSAAYLCLLLNIFLPGLGTAASGLLVHCMGRTRYSVETTKQDRWASTCTNLVVALMQLYTLTFCLVGWFWSVGWGVIMVTVADQHRSLQSMSAEERAAQTRRTSFQQLISSD